MFYIDDNHLMKQTYIFTTVTRLSKSRVRTSVVTVRLYRAFESLDRNRPALEDDDTGFNHRTY